jgi:DNA-binding winged helix-turn-helix (wHTH) protein
MPINFGAFTLDWQTRQLLQDTRPVPLSPKALELIAMLVEQRPAAVSKAAIHQQLWPDTFVSDGNVAVLVADIRRALGDNARRPLFVRTIHRFGYAFVAAAAEVERSTTLERSATTCWLASGHERIPLHLGENVLGRGPIATVRVGLDPAADLRSDPEGISRRHAMIVVTDTVATLHDLSSKNGTFVDGVRVTSPVKLVHGSQIRFGGVLVHFRQLIDGSSTRTLDLPGSSVPR